MGFVDASFFEMLFLACFGVSWPINIVKAVRSKTASGVSIGFLTLIFMGYVFGIIAKLLEGSLTYTFALYIINIAMVSVCIVLYFINKHRDSMALIQNSQAA